MKLYHGSPIPGITTLHPRLSNHGKPYVYLTDCPALAVIYAHNPLPPPEGYFPYLFDKEGQLCYEEYFPNALDLYKGFRGYVYTAEAEGLNQLEKMPWVYLSQEPVAVTGCRFIPDLYEELLALNEAGGLKLIRFGDLTEQKLQGIYGMLRREAQRENLKDHPESAYAQFYQAHFPFLL